MPLGVSSAEKMRPSKYGLRPTRPSIMSSRFELEFEHTQRSPLTEATASRAPSIASKSLARRLSVSASAWSISEA